MADETTGNDQPLPPPIEGLQQDGNSIDQILESSVANVIGEGDGADESSAPSPEPGTPASPSSTGEPSETPGSVTEPAPGESDAPGQAKPTEPGESPFFSYADQSYTKDDIAGLVDANANRDAFQKAAQEQAEKIEKQVSSLEQAKQQIAAEKAAVAKQKEEAEAYGGYIRWMKEGGSGDLEEYAQISGQRAAPAAASPQQSQEDLDARIARVLKKTIADERTQSRTQSIEESFDGWTDEIVKAEPSLKGRELAYGAAITQRFVGECQKQKVHPTQFTETQIKGFLRQYAREAAQAEQKISETTVAERLDSAARTGEKLPAVPRTQGTPLPAQPNAFKMDLKKLAQESPDTDSFFDQFTKQLKEKSDELSSMAKNLG